MNYKEATALLIQKLEEKKSGYGKVNFRMRDAGYSRQRYWGEPFPIYYDKDGIIHTVAEDKLPVILPNVDSYKPTGTGESPLATATEWVAQNGEGTRMETDTMPGYAGSSWYFLRYMDPNNSEELVSKEAQEYWQNVDFYVGGSEHAVGHLLYSRFWHKFLKDIGKVSTEEPFKKMVNQGMIQGVSKFVFADNVIKLNTYNRVTNFSNMIYISKGLKDLLFLGKMSIDDMYSLIKNQYPHLSIGEVVKGLEHKTPHWTTNALHIDIKYVDSVTDILNFKKLIEEDINFKDAIFITEEDGNYYCGREVEKMSKSKFNVVNPDQIIEQHGADTFRMYEMFLGPIDTAKPWDTNGISGVSNFLRKFWRLFYDDFGVAKNIDVEPTQEELKILHKTIKKVNEDIERLGFNTCVSTFMIGVNELSKLKTVSKSTLSDLVKLISPFAPHMAEVLWSNLGNESSVVDAAFPTHDAQYLVESAFNYPIQINGKHRANIEIPLDMPQDEIQKLVLADEKVLKFTESNPPKKFIVVPGRIINVVV
jgi:leucyl-tRNA synthetase